MFQVKSELIPLAYDSVKEAAFHPFLEQNMPKGRCVISANQLKQFNFKCQITGLPTEPIKALMTLRPFLNTAIM